MRRSVRVEAPTRCHVHPPPLPGRLGRRVGRGGGAEGAARDRLVRPASPLVPDASSPVTPRCRPRSHAESALSRLAPRPGLGSEAQKLRRAAAGAAVCDGATAESPGPGRRKTGARIRRAAAASRTTASGGVRSVYCAQAGPSEGVGGARLPAGCDAGQAIAAAPRRGIPAGGVCGGTALGKGRRRSARSIGDGWTGAAFP